MIKMIKTITTITAPVTPTAARFEALFWSMTAICGAVGLAVIVTIVVFVIRFHHRRDRGDATPVEHTTRIEATWTLLTFVIFAGLFTFGVRGFRELDPHTFTNEAAREDPLEILVTAKRWMWKFDHTNAGPRELDVLHVPAGRPIRLHMTSEDVIHSFFVPAFRLKHDVLPGRTTTLQFQVDVPGSYPLLCAEYCGRDHSRMRGQIMVMSARDYSDWEDERADEPASLVSGELLFHKYQCYACHVDDGHGLRHGPALAGLFGRSERLADGREIEVDEPYLRESILVPGAALVAGWPPNMPAYVGRLSEAELTQLLMYLRNLE